MMTTPAAPVIDCAEAAKIRRQQTLTHIAVALLTAAQHVDHFDPACDRTLHEVCEEAGWLAGRSCRNAGDGIRYVDPTPVVCPDGVFVWPDWPDSL